MEMILVCAQLSEKLGRTKNVCGNDGNGFSSLRQMQMQPMIVHRWIRNRRKRTRVNDINLKKNEQMQLFRRRTSWAHTGRVHSTRPSTNLNKIELTLPLANNSLGRGLNAFSIAGCFTCKVCKFLLTIGASGCRPPNNAWSDTRPGVLLVELITTNGPAMAFPVDGRKSDEFRCALASDEWVAQRSADGEPFATLLASCIFKCSFEPLFPASVSNGFEELIARNGCGWLAFEFCTAGSSVNLCNADDCNFSRRSFSKGFVIDCNSISRILLKRKLKWN